MTTSLTIPDDLVEQLADLRGEVNPKTSRRWTYADLSALLAESFNITASREAVRRAVSPVLAERRGIAREAMREQMLTTLPKQAETLDSLMAKVGADALKAKPSARAALADTYRKMLETKLRFGGIGERLEIDADITADGTVAVTVRDARDELAARLARLPGAAPRDEPGGAPGAGEEPLPGGG